jgi:hypothetical protein
MHLCVETDGYSPVDPASLANKALFGYQGWFSAPGDGSSLSWSHWAPGVKPNASNADFDLWPDLSEFAAEELFETDLTLADGSAAGVFSSYRYATVNRHFRWMAERGGHGVFLQRFTSELGSPAHLAFRNQVTQNVRDAAEENGRVFAIMYDITGTPEGSFEQILKEDWAFLVEEMGITDSPAYLHHEGRPVLGIWGMGFTDRPGTPAQWTSVIDHFQDTAPPSQLVTVVGGVPSRWRTGTEDSKPGFAGVYGEIDILCPWSVGRFDSNPSFDGFFANIVQPDVQWTNASGQGYAPVVWPGFSWANLVQDPTLFNTIPREGGTFFWHQVVKHHALSPLFVFLAMFDEVDEATALFKAAPSAADVPDGTFLSLDADGWSLPSDWYLRLSGAACRAAEGGLTPSGALPYLP